jgi:plasmid stabilization system protein ParE
MRFLVRTTEQADGEADAILAWLILQGAGDAGFRWFLELERAIASLADMPLRCAMAPENAKVSFDVRQLLYGRKPHVYRILFTIEGDTVYVLHIRHGRRRHLSEP